MRKKEMPEGTKRGGGDPKSESLPANGPVSVIVVEFFPADQQQP